MGVVLLFISAPLLLSLPFSFIQNFPLLLSFPAFSPFQKLFPPSLKTLPPGKLIVSGIHRHKWSGAAACAWGAGDTKLGQPALLPRLQLLPTPEGLGQRHAHGRNNVSK